MLDNFALVKKKINFPKFSGFQMIRSITLFIASSRAEEMGTVKKLIVSILNRNKN